MDKRPDISAQTDGKPKLLRAILLYVSGVLFLAVGILYVIGIYNDSLQKKTTQTINVAHAATSFISADLISEISDGQINSNSYLRVKDELIRFKERNDDVSSLFIYTELEGNLVALAHSETSGLGFIPETMAKECREVLTEKEPIITKDAQGPWQTVLVPFENTGNGGAALSINYSASAWKSEIIRRTVHSGLEIVFVFVLLTVIFKLYRKNSLLANMSRRLNEREDVFKKLFEHLPMGVALVEDDKQGVKAVNKKFEAIMGRSQHELTEICMEELTGSDDEHNDADRVALLGQGNISSNTTIKKIDKPDGQTAWIHMNVVSLNKGDDKSGKSHLCIVEDVTQRILTETALRESERSKAVLLAHLPGMAYRCRKDHDWTMLFVSEGCRKLTGYEPDSLLYNKDISFNSLIAPEYRKNVWLEWDRVLAQKEPFNGEYEIVDKDGRHRWVMEMGQGIYDEEGNVVALEGLIIDVTEQKLREAQIKHMSDHDFLTGLYNRKFFEQEKERLAEERYLPVSVIIANINGVRLINDAFGHAEGDLVIIEAASFMKRRCREGDILARTGGDEFTLLLPNTDAHEAYSILRSIHKACEQHNSMSPNRRYDVSVSMGFGTKTLKNETIEQAAKEAEEYMHNRKLLNRRSSHSSILSSITATMYERSQETEAHAERLSELSKKIGRQLQLPQKSLDELELFAMLHDIGKVGIDDRILNKPGKLSEEEWAVMKRHPEIGYRIAVSSPELEPIAEYILSHHERWDGKGYPQGLKGEHIPLLSRILAVVDAYDAMTEDRVYRKALPKEQALEEIKKNAGTQFDPDVAQRFIEIIS